MAKTNTIKGFTDFIGPDAKKREKMKAIIKSTFESYGFEPAETPIIESEEFVRGGNANDEAVRDIFKLKDRGERELALRYEFTFQLKRIAKNQKLPYKRFQIGDIFRDEPIRKGRLRQFIQCDADIIGSTIKDEAECLKMSNTIFDKLGISATVYVNNRKLINEIMVEQGIEERYRDQAIREIDKLDKLSKKEVADNLKKFGAEKLLEIFTQEDSAFEKYNFYKEIKELKEACNFYGVKVTFRPYMARGLSYYNGTVFEIWSDELGVALTSGGSYLVGDIQSTGISFGLEPLFLISNVIGNNTKVQIISLDQDKKAIQLAERFREKGITVNLMMDKTIKKAMEYANSKEIENVLIIGEKEIENKAYKLKNMKTGEEKELDEKGLIKELS